MNKDYTHHQLEPLRTAVSAPQESEMATNPTAAQLATIATQFITAGEDQDIALAKANTLYFAAARYLKTFNTMTPGERAMDIDDQDTVHKLLSIPGRAAVEYFRSTATTKTDQNISEKTLIKLLKREVGRVPEMIPPQMLDALHVSLRRRRSQARSERRKKSVK
jgi:hypothetical protein